MKRIMLLLAIVALLVTSCTAVANAQLTNARNRWQADNISHYRYNLRLACFCVFTDLMPLTIEVNDGKVVSILYSDGSAVPTDQLQAFAPYQTIDALFGFTAESLAKADKIAIKYDATYGFPTDVQIDFIKQAADDELGLFVTDFQPLP